MIYVQNQIGECSEKKIKLHFHEYFIYVLEGNTIAF